MPQYTVIFNTFFLENKIEIKFLFISVFNNVSYFFASLCRYLYY